MDTIRWLEPWTPLAEGEPFEAELRREMCPQHALYGRTVVALGRRRDYDDVLFQVLGGTAPFAVVHLTWRSDGEPEPWWPRFRLYADLSEWREHCMERDHRAWSARQPQ